MGIERQLIESKKKKPDVRGHRAKSKSVDVVKNITAIKGAIPGQLGTPSTRVRSGTVDAERDPTASRVGASNKGNKISVQITESNLAPARLVMGDRVILLCRLGQGASSVVYKALDLQSMHLVAIKMISVHER
jgi:hypothetical protein